MNREELRPDNRAVTVTVTVFNLSFPKSIVFKFKLVCALITYRLFY